MCHTGFPVELSSHFLGEARMWHWKFDEWMIMCFNGENRTLQMSRSWLTVYLHRVEIQLFFCATLFLGVHSNSVSVFDKTLFVHTVSHAKSHSIKHFLIQRANDTNIVIVSAPNNSTCDDSTSYQWADSLRCIWQLFLIFSIKYCARMRRQNGITTWDGGGKSLKKEKTMANSIV